MEHLTELRDRVLTLPALENRLALLQSELREAEGDVAELLLRYERESRDVERIRRKSLSAFLLKAAGRYEARLEKELREELDAKLDYDRAATRRDSLAGEIDALAARIVALRGDRRAYQAALAAARRGLADAPDDPRAARFAELSAEREAIASQITEIREALGAAARASSTAQSARDSLKSAQNWATYDAFTRGGIITHVAKYSHVDDAERLFHTLSSQLRDLRRELGDVHGLSQPGFSEISPGRRAVDFWLDNIFTDLSIRGQIKDNAAEIDRLLGRLFDLTQTLNGKLRAEQSRLDENRRREEELLVAAR